MDNTNQRIAFYMGTCVSNVKQKLSNKNFENIHIGNYFRPTGFAEEPKLPEDFIKNFKNYINPLQHKLKKLGHTDAVMLMVGDVGNGGDHEECYAFSKTRSIGGHGRYTLLKCLNYQRHWSPNAYDGNLNWPIDKLKFKHKKSKIVWRGATTGFPSGHPRYHPADRFTLVENFFLNNDFIDVGFSSIIQNQDAYEKYIKTTMSIEEFRSFKYIMSVEGNDKDSGLNWKLKSNSVVFMPKPRISSWLMEETLIDKFHYIQVNDDFSDLQEKFIWCEDNPNICADIIENAQTHMGQFEDLSKENYIEDCVIKKHIENVNYRGG
jgi:hypothetical protein